MKYNLLFVYSINLKFGSTWGYLINGSFNGILGDMIKGEVDIAAVGLQFKPERIPIMDWTVVTWNGK